MSIKVEVQYAAAAAEVPARKDLRRWVKAALGAQRQEAELTIRIVGEAEGAELNRRWRNGRGPSNVLSFGYEDLEDIVPALLGDIVICAPVVAREAAEQHKAADAHWAHLVVHGVLHLLGFDHVLEQEALAMEALEAKVLARLGFPDPYTVRHST